MKNFSPSTTAFKKLSPDQMHKIKGGAVPTNYLDFLFCVEYFPDIRSCHNVNVGQAQLEVCLKKSGVNGKCLEIALGQ